MVTTQQTNNELAELPTVYGGDANSHLVSVRKARRTLGSLANNMTDNQVQEIIDAFTLLARESLQYNGSKDTVLSNELSRPNDTH